MEQAFTAVEEELKRDEAEKDLLCSELNTLVMQSATLQVTARTSWVRV